MDHTPRPLLCLTPQHSFILPGAIIAQLRNHTLPLLNITFFCTNRARVKILLQLFGVLVLMQTLREKPGFELRCCVRLAGWILIDD
jgi:hypothetical protein